MVALACAYFIVCPYSHVVPLVPLVSLLFTAKESPHFSSIIVHMENQYRIVGNWLQYSYMFLVIFRKQGCSSIYCSVTVGVSSSTSLTG